MENQKIKILIIGSMLTGKQINVGGTTVSCTSMVDSMKNINAIKLSIINTSGIRSEGILGLYRFILLVFRLMIRLTWCDVIIVNVNTSALHLLGTLVATLNLLFRRAFIIRKFANTDYRIYGKIPSIFSDWVIRQADMFLVETKVLKKTLEEMGYQHIKWFPNNRSMEALPNDTNSNKKKCRRFIYLSQMVQGKGIAHIINAGERFGDGISIDLYGPSGYDVPLSWFEGLKRVHYQGFAENAVETIANYDVLLLPTILAQTEGYPGVILEAYSVGLPVICSRFPSLMEIVDETSGILIDPNSSDALFEAMNQLIEDDALYQRLRKGVKNKRIPFSSEYWTEKMIEFCIEAMYARNHACKIRINKPFTKE